MVSDRADSVVYLFDATKADAIRVYLRIKPQNGKIVWCEGIINSISYRKRYNAEGQGRQLIPSDPARTVTMGAWYRLLLGIDKRNDDERLVDAELHVRFFKRSNWSFTRWWAAIRVTQQHPVSTNRIAMNLALLGVALGTISLITPFL